MVDLAAYRAGLEEFVALSKLNADASKLTNTIIASSQLIAGVTKLKLSIPIWSNKMPYHTANAKAAPQDTIVSNQTMEKLILVDCRCFTFKLNYTLEKHGNASITLDSFCYNAYDYQI